MITTIGLEVHVQLNTKTKIFCGCAVEFGSAPNSNVCPVCLGLPGSLPMLNKVVFMEGLKAVIALGGTPSAIVKFDRKNYFYPDLPKGYQISQYDHPLGKGGFIEILRNGAPAKIRLNRLHLEEDAGKLLHDQSPDSSLVDLNRAGTPLAEIVSEPDLSSSEEAYEYLTELKAILKSIGVSECDMEKGQLRCDANVSVRKNQSDPYGTRVEIKNLNSFKSVKAAIEHEVERQSAAFEKGEKVLQETRLWDDNRQKTFPMRSKEEAHDYRYFPEPDLVPFTMLDAKKLEEIKKALPELPKQKKERFVREFKLSEYDAKLLTQDADISDFFQKCIENEDVVKGQVEIKDIANWITSGVFKLLNEKKTNIRMTKLTSGIFVKLILLVKQGRVSMQMGKEKVLGYVIDGHDPQEVIKKEGLEQVSDDSAIFGWIKEVIQSNEKVVGDFRSGKETAAMFLVGQVMKKSQGKANPNKVRSLLLEKLKDS